MSIALMKKLKEMAKKVKEKAENRESDFEKIDWFKPELGENSIRFLPHWKKPDDSLPWVELRIHFIPKVSNSGKQYVIPARCLSDFEEDCPLCVAYEKLMNSGDKEGAKRLRPQTRFIYNLLNYKDRKVQPYMCGQQIHVLLASWIGDVDGNLFDIDSGYDFKLVKSQKAGVPKMVGTSYGLRPLLKPSSIPEKLRVLLESMPDLSKMYDTKEIKVMNEFLGTKSSEEEEEEEDERPSRSSVERAKLASSKARARMPDEDDEEEQEAPRKKVAKKAPVEEDEDEQEAPRKKVAKKAPVEEDEDEQENMFKPKKKPFAAKSKPVEDDEDEEVDDDDLEQELRKLGV